ncbi:MAG: response regulator [Acetobacteraceae bacterium]|nr:response regulator [Acetobacteraceae bacterium]
MPYRPSIAADRRAAARLLRLLSVAAIVLPLAVLAGGSAIAWRNQQRDTWDSTARLTDLVYECFSKLFEAQLLVLDETQALTDGLDDAALQAGEAELHQRLATMLVHLPHVRDVFVVGRQARVLVDGVTYPAPYRNDVGDRDYMQHFAAGGGGLFVSIHGARKVDGLRDFTLAIPRSRQGGAYAGVIAASVAPEFFEGYFRQAVLAYGAPAARTISIRRTDGALLVRSGADQAISAADAAVFADRVRQAIGPSGRFEVALADTGQHRLVAWRRLPSVDMIVLTSIDRSAMLQTWAWSIVTQLYFGVPVTLALFGITLLALRRTTQAANALEQAAVEMARREQAEEAVRQSQKMEALGKLTGGVAHDFNNLLAVILGSAELAKQRPPERVARLLDNILHAGQRAATLTRQLLSFSRTQNVAPQVLDLQGELPRMLELLTSSLRCDIDLTLDIAGDAWPVKVDPGEFEIALLNVAVNARDAMPSGGRFTIAATNRTVARLDVAEAPALAGDFVAIGLSDTGSGMTAEVAARAFEPFFTTKDIGHGTGLGLSQVYGFARQAGGAATIDSPPRGGTRITLLLPRSAHPPQPQATDPPMAAQPHAGLRVLLVEDNAEVAAITSEMLHSLGWQVVVAERARPTLERLAERFDLLLSDVVMPDGMSGLELAHAARIRWPDLPILLVSGYSQAVATDQAAFPVLRKPFSLDQLAQAVHQVMGEHLAVTAGR